MYPAVSLCAAAGCLLASIYCYRHRDGVLRFMTRMRGYDPPDWCAPLPPGTRRRYLNSARAGVDMLSPAIGLLLLALVFLVSGVLALR